MIPHNPPQLQRPCPQCRVNERFRHPVGGGLQPFCSRHCHNLWSAIAELCLNCNASPRCAHPLGVLAGELALNQRRLADGRVIALDIYCNTTCASQHLERQILSSM